MMKWKVILALLVALGCLAAVVDCGRRAKAKVALEKKLEELVTTLENTRAERNSLKAEIMKISDSLKIAESQLVCVVRQYDRLQQQVKELTDAGSRLKSRVERLIQSKEELQQCVDVVSQERDQLREELQALSKSNAELRPKVATLTESRGELQQKVGTLTQSRDDLKERLDEVTNARDKLEEQLKMFTEGQTELEKSMRELARRWDTVLADMGNMRARVRLLVVPEFVESTNDLGARKEE